MESSQVSTKAHVKDIKEENKVVHQTVRETSSKFSKLEFEKQKLHRDLEQVTKKVEQVEELEKDFHRLQKENQKLAKEVTSLTMSTEKVDTLECVSQSLMLESQRLQTSLEILQNVSVQLYGLERDNKQLDEENLELRKIGGDHALYYRYQEGQIEKENQELEWEEEVLNALSKKLEHLKLSYQSLSAENLQL